MECERTPLDERLQGLGSTYEVIRRTAERMPEKTAFHMLEHGAAEEDSRQISYGRFFARVTQTANMLHDLGVGPGEVVSYILPNLPETHYVLWGGEAAGIVNPINPLLETDHMIAIMKAAGSRVLVTLGPAAGADIWQKAMRIKDHVPSLRHIVQVAGPPQPGAICYDHVIDGYSAEKLDSGRIIRPGDICSYFHTGGTTGAPKLARHSHFNEVTDAFLAAIPGDIVADDVALSGLPLFHVNAAIVTGLSCFLVGASVVLATAAGYRTPAVIGNFWRIVEKYRVSFFSGVPTIYAGLLQAPLGDADVSSLRMAICGAAPMPRDVIRRFEKTTGITLLEGYGLTEGTCVSSCNPLYGERKVGSIGLRLPYQDMKAVLLDGEGQYVRDCAADEVGAIVIRGPNVFAGYLQPEANRDVWLDGGWFNTGDMGRADGDGYFWLTGRVKELIIRGGHNIDPALIENALALHDEVIQVAAVGKPDIYAGELPVAYVVLKAGSTCTAESLRDFARGHIAERAAAPKEIYLVEALPLTAVGKIFKPALKENAVKRAIKEVLMPFRQEVKISVDPDRTYGTVATIEIGSSVSDQTLEEMKQALDGYAFHRRFHKINKKYRDYANASSKT